MSDDFILYVSDQAHSSVARAARVLEFTPEQVRVLPTERELPAAPGDARGSDRRRRGAGLPPLRGKRERGRDQTGAVDPLAELAETCEREASGSTSTPRTAASRRSSTGRVLLRGIELADSVTLDPHKWLYQSYECGGLLVSGRARSAPRSRSSRPISATLGPGQRGEPR